MPPVDSLEVRCSCCERFIGHKPADGLQIRPWMGNPPIKWGICPPCEKTVRMLAGLGPVAAC